MMIDNRYPRTKNDLVRAIQKMRINKIEVIDGYTSADERALTKTAKNMSAGSGDVTIILVRSCSLWSNTWLSVKTLKNAF